MRNPSNTVFPRSSRVSRGTGLLSLGDWEPLLSTRLLPAGTYTRTQFRSGAFRHNPPLSSPQSLPGYGFLYSMVNFVVTVSPATVTSLVIFSLVNMFAFAPAILLLLMWR